MCASVSLGISATWYGVFMEEIFSIPFTTLGEVTLNNLYKSGACMLNMIKRCRG